MLTRCSLACQLGILEAKKKPGREPHPTTTRSTPPRDAFRLTDDSMTTSEGSSTTTPAVSTES
jgi:hypothetical protein